MPVFDHIRTTIFHDYVHDRSAKCEMFCFGGKAMTQDESEDVWERNPLLSLTGPRSPEIVLIDISLQQQEFPIGSLCLHARRKTQAVFRVETENESARVLIVHQAKRSKKWQKCSVCSLSMKTRCSARYRMVNWRLHQLSTTFIMKDDYRWVFFFFGSSCVETKRAAG